MADVIERVDSGSPQKSLAQIYGVLVAALGIIGLFVTEGHLFKLMNTDTTMDVLRLLLAAALLYAGFASKNNGAIRDILMFTGVLYVILAILALLSSTLWDLFPTGLTGFDVIFHLLAGLLAIAVAASGRPASDSRDTTP